MTARRRITAEIKGADAAIEVAGVLDELAGAVSAFEISEADALWRVEGYPRAPLVVPALEVELAFTAAAAGAGQRHRLRRGAGRAPSCPAQRPRRAHTCRLRVGIPQPDGPTLPIRSDPGQYSGPAIGADGARSEARLGAGRGRGPGRPLGAAGTAGTLGASRSRARAAAPIAHRGLVDPDPELRFGL